MTKQDQFLFVVQTTILANGISLQSLPEVAEKYRHVYSAGGVLGLMDDALDASKRIPEDLSAFEAALDFCTFMLANLREQEEKASGKHETVPDWFAKS
jgi:hypothetical protein